MKSIHIKPTYINSPSYRLADAPWYHKAFAIVVLVVVAIAVVFGGVWAN